MPSVSDFMYTYTVIGIRNGEEVNKREYHRKADVNRKVYVMKQSGVYDEIKVTKRYREITNDQSDR